MVAIALSRTSSSQIRFQSSRSTRRLPSPMATLQASETWTLPRRPRKIEDSTLMCPVRKETAASRWMPRRSASLTVSAIA